jgi:hypothetical protein
MFSGRTLSAVNRILLSFATLGVLSCSAERATQPPRPDGPSALIGFEPKGNLVECRTDETLKTSAVIDPEAPTTISLGGTQVVFPVGAVLNRTTIELTIPASKYVEIQVRANGAEHFYDLQLPVTITIDYSRCTRTDVLSKPLTAWYIDSETKELLQPMGGVDNKLTRSVTFTTDHFSGYAIAF